MRRLVAGAQSPGFHAYVVIGSVSLSMLMYELLLTRVSALRLFFHFGFLVVSNCLLGIGAAGTVIALNQERWRRDPRRYIWRSCQLYVASLVVAWIFILNFELPANFNLLEPAQFLDFSLFNAVSALPFAFAGAVVGMSLSFYASSVNRLYFTDLVGASLGCLVFPFCLEAVGAGGVFVLLCVAAWLSLVVAAPLAWRRPVLAVTAIALPLSLWLMPRLDGLAPLPGKGDLQLTATYTANTSEVSEFSRWSPNSRIDLVPVQAEKRILLGRGTRALQIPLPETKFILQDGTAGTLIYDFSGEPASLHALELSLYSAAVRLKREPSVFVIGVGGGNDVWAARAAGARRVKGVELNRPILDIHSEVLPHFSRDLLEDERVELVHGEGRSSLMRERRLYDVVQMTGVDTWTGLASGAYVLAENYLYTTDAIQDMYARLEEGGLIQITRFALEVESLRLLSNLRAALRELGVDGFSESVICLASLDGLFTVLVKKGAFTDEEIERTRDFAEEAGIALRHLPGRPPNSAIARFVRAPDAEAFVRDYPRNISPTTDDQPYFFNFTRWDLAGDMRFGADPASVSQGDPSFILAQLLLSTVLAAVLILLPLVASRRQVFQRRFALRFLVYFVGLGAGFIAIEVALMQKLTLLLGHPLYSITVTLFSVLLFAGLGSLASASWFTSSRRGEWLVPGGIATSLLLFVALSPRLVDSAIALPLAGRVATAIAMLAPISFLLGIPLPYGIRLLSGLNPSLIPWSWAVNGCLSVIGSVLTVVASMNLGFDAVLLGAAALYVVSFAALPRHASAGG